MTEPRHVDAVLLRKARAAHQLGDSNLYRGNFDRGGYWLKRRDKHIAQVNILRGGPRVTTEKGYD